MDIFDPQLLIFALIGLIGGMMTVVTAGSMLILVPSFTLLGFPPLATLLLGRLIVTGASGTGALGFYRAGMLKLSTLALLIVSGGIGALVGVYLSTLVDPHLFAKIFPWMIALGVPLIFVSPPTLKNTQHLMWILPLYAFLAGGFAAFGGAIGLINVVFLCWALSYDIRAASMHARAFEFFVNLVSIPAYLAYGIAAPFLPACSALIGALLGGWIGSHITLRTKPLWLKIAIATVGLGMLAKAFMM